jgi:ABC-type sugar transport system permease subunit
MKKEDFQKVYNEYFQQKFNFKDPRYKKSEWKDFSKDSYYYYNGTRGNTFYTNYYNEDEPVNKKNNFSILKFLGIFALISVVLNIFIGIVFAPTKLKKDSIEFKKQQEKKNEEIYGKKK